MLRENNTEGFSRAALPNHPFTAKWYASRWGPWCMSSSTKNIKVKSLYFDLLRRDLCFLNCLFFCVRAEVCARVQMPLEERKGIRCPGDGATGGCKLLEVCRHQTWVLCRSSTCVSPLGYLSRHHFDLSIQKDEEQKAEKENRR